MCDSVRLLFFFFFFCSSHSIVEVHGLFRRSLFRLTPDLICVTH